MFLIIFHLNIYKIHTSKYVPFKKLGFYVIFLKYSLLLKDT